MWVLIDNYDSFTWILHDYILQTGNECAVYRNDEITLPQLETLNPERLILSPGPETPIQAGVTMGAIHQFHSRVPILGVCLGHQALGMYFGAKLVHSKPMHGKVSQVKHNEHPLFRDVPSPFMAMRYHSLALEGFDNHATEPIAMADDGTVMAIAHTELPLLGVQFHPESVGTRHGMQILKNWARMY